MKKLFKLLGVLAFASIFVIGCAKPTDSEVPEVPEVYGGEMGILALTDNGTKFTLYDYPDAVPSDEDLKDVNAYLETLTKLMSGTIADDKITVDYVCEEFEADGWAVGATFPLVKTDDTITVTMGEKTFEFEKESEAPEGEEKLLEVSFDWGGSVADEGGVQVVTYTNAYGAAKIGTGIFKKDDKIVITFAEVPTKVQFYWVDENPTITEASWGKAVDQANCHYSGEIKTKEFEFTFEANTFPGDDDGWQSPVALQACNSTDATCKIDSIKYYPAK